MTGPATFDDDADTVPGCTGACCDPVTLSVERYRAVSSDPQHVRNGRYVLTMLTPRGPLPRHGAASFDCRYFDRETRLCAAYDRRPEMCRTFPEKGVCHLCGGRFGTQAQPEATHPATAAAERARLSMLRAIMGQAPARADEPPNQDAEP